jgi:hypothetical protein
MTRWLPAAAFALACSGGAAFAQTPPTSALTTATLAELCGAAPATSEAPATAFCRGFIIGAGQHHAVVSRVAGTRPAFCMPNPGPTQQEFQTAFATWVRANPQYGQEAAVEGLIRFAAATWPCPPAPATPAPTRSRR